MVLPLSTIEILPNMMKATVKFGLILVCEHPCPFYILEHIANRDSITGHCYLMVDSLSEAYHAYQTALYHLQDLSQPRLWYGIGILYDRYGSLEHAEEAFSQVMRMAPDFEKANEIYFRLGIIYKQQQKFSASLDVSLSY